MPRAIYSNAEIMANIQTMTETEDGMFGAIPGWTGEYVADTPNAVLLFLPERSWRESEVWFPMRHLRKTSDGQSVYASLWILAQKGLG